MSLTRLPQAPRDTIAAYLMPHTWFAPQLQKTYGRPVQYSDGSGRPISLERNPSIVDRYDDDWCDQEIRLARKRGIVL
jgi:hypothetical protein